MPDIFATLDEAKAYSPAVAPNFMVTAGYFSAGDGGGAQYKKVSAQPTHAGKFSITLSGGGTTWYELSIGQPISVEMFGAIGHKTDAAALAGGAANSTTAILNAIEFLRNNGDTLNDGLTNKIITAYTSGTLHFGRGIFNITAGAIRITQDINLIWQGQGCGGKTIYARAATTILITGTSSGFGIEAYGNGSRGFRQIDIDICYATSGFTGNILSLIGSPGSYPERCKFGTFGIRGSQYLYTPRSCISIAYDEFFNPKECVFTGAERGIRIEDDNRLAVFTGSISGNTLTVTAMVSGEIGTDLRIWDTTTGSLIGRSIVSLGTGTGGIGTYVLDGAAASLSSRTLAGDLSWGGSNSHIGDCVFYDLTTKAVEFRGARRRTRQSIKDSIMNPINLGGQNGWDLRNIDGLALDNNDHVGSVGFAPTNGWLYIENCTGTITSCVFGDGAVGIQASGFLNITGNVFNGTLGVNIFGESIVAGKGNEYILTAGPSRKGFTLGSLSANITIDVGPDRFNGNCSSSYDFPTGAAAKGRVYRAISHDFSQNGALNGAVGVTITSV